MARLRLNPNPSAVHLDDALGYGEPQPGAALLAGNRIVGLLKLLKQLGLISRGDARSGVADRYVECAIVRLGLDADFASIGELDRVADEIDQDLRYAVSPLAACCAIFWRSSSPIFGRPILIPLARARAMPAFVRSLIFCASIFAKDDNSASRTFQTSSLSVARCAPV
jgi:hypothetical protein